MYFHGIKVRLHICFQIVTTGPYPKNDIRISLTVTYPSTVSTIHETLKSSLTGSPCKAESWVYFFFIGFSLISRDLFSCYTNSSRISFGTEKRQSTCCKSALLIMRGVSCILSLVRNTTPYTQSSCRLQRLNV